MGLDSVTLHSKGAACYPLSVAVDAMADQGGMCMLKLTREGCIRRRNALLERTDADLLVIANPRHIQYLTGLYVTPLQLSAWGSSFLFIDGRSGEATLVVHNGLAPAAELAHADKVASWRSYDFTTLPGVDSYAAAIPELRKQLAPYAGERVGIEPGWFPFGVEVSDTVEIASTLHDMRRVKDPDELVLLREAMTANEAAHRAARELIRPGITELDVYNAIHAAITNATGGPVLLLGDFASGDRAETGGGPPTARTLKAGDLMILDIFPVVNGYRADNTATLSVDRKLTPRQKAIEIGLNEALTAGAETLRPGARAAEVYEVVRASLAEHDLAEGFTHHAGHGLGLGQPEAPYFVPSSDEVLRAGEVVTLEPGWYGEGTGARIERNFLVTEAAPEMLSRHPTTFA